MGRPAVFLDRDGTIIGEVDYLRRPKDVRLLPHAAAAIRRLNEAGLPVVVTTNQSGIARGMLTEKDLEAIHDVLRHRLPAPAPPPGAPPPPPSTSAPPTPTPAAGRTADAVAVVSPPTVCSCARRKTSISISATPTPWVTASATS